MMTAVVFSVCDVVAVVMTCAECGTFRVKTVHHIATVLIGISLPSYTMLLK